jgi:uncharacterized OsmC-like protein
MGRDRIRDAVLVARERLVVKPESARFEDTPVTVTCEEGLRFRAIGPAGEVFLTAMPTSVGGDGVAPTSGWFSRLALASCTGTVIALRAAELGRELDDLEVTVESTSDGRGLVGGLDEPARPLHGRIRMTVEGAGIDDDVLTDLRHWLDRHSPVRGTLRFEVPTSVELERGRPGA